MRIEQTHIKITLYVCLFVCVTVCRRTCVHSYKMIRLLYDCNIVFLLVCWFPFEIRQHHQPTRCSKTYSHTDAAKEERRERKKNWFSRQFWSETVEPRLRGTFDQTATTWK